MKTDIFDPIGRNRICTPTNRSNCCDPTAAPTCNRRNRHDPNGVKLQNEHVSRSSFVQCAIGQEVYRNSGGNRHSRGIRLIFVVFSATLICLTRQRSGWSKMGKSILRPDSHHHRAGEASGESKVAGLSSLNRQFLGGMSALAWTQFPDTRRDVFIQFDAASNRGNSG